MTLPRNVTINYELMRARSRTRNTIIFGALLLMIAAVVATVPMTGAKYARSSRTAALNPLSSWTLFNYHNTPAAAEVLQLRAEGKTRDAELMEMIAKQPIATWFTRTSKHVGKEVEALTTRAAQAGAVAVIVSYDIPGQGCGRSGAGRGLSSSSAYMSQMRAMARGIGNRRTIVILEPDALPFSLLGCRIHLGTLKRAVETLATASGARTYIDAGNSTWAESMHLLAQALHEADIRQTAGFSLNVSNFQTDGSSIAFGQELSRLLGGAHFVIDTSRNGAGPDTNPADAPLWCNPPGRALGVAPTTRTGVAELDAYLWIKPPGASDEACRPGEPAAGGWWRAYALELASNAAARSAAKR